MRFLSCIQEAYAYLLATKWQSCLAILSMSIGTIAITTLMTGSELAIQDTLKQVSALGNQTIGLHLNKKEHLRDANASDFQSLDIKTLRDLSPKITSIAAYTSFSEILTIRGEPIYTSVIGATHTLAALLNIKLDAGRFVSRLDRHSPYCVIGQNIALRLKKKAWSTPLQKEIFLGDWSCTIIGVMRSWTPSWLFYLDLDNSIIIPINTSQLIHPSAPIDNLLMHLKHPSDIPDIKNKIHHTLEKFWPALEPHFQTPAALTELIKKQRYSLNWLLRSIASISILIAGLGIMNLMLLSISKRHHEIGIRMAVGATPSNILSLFLVESALLGGLGGIMGVIISILATKILTLITGWTFMICYLPPILGFTLSLCVSVISGAYPAYRASRLDPMTTLRET